MSEPAKYVRRSIRLTCSEGHRWTAERIAKITGYVHLLSKPIEVLEHVSMEPKLCPRCARAAQVYEPLTDYTPQ